MNKLLRLSMLFCCSIALQNLSANEDRSQDQDDESPYDQHTYTYHADEYDSFSEQTEPSCKAILSCNPKRRSKVPHDYHIAPKILVPQTYYVTFCRLETVESEFVDECGRIKKCFHKVPHYYREERCRMVPHTCNTIVRKYENECYNVNDAQVPTRDDCGDPCEYCPIISTNSFYEGSFNVDFGYRRDNLNCVLNHFDPPGFFLVNDNLKINAIQIMEIGIKGKVIAKNCFMLKGFAYTGEVVNGKYIEKATGNTGLSATINLKAHGGQTLDTSIGVGVLLPLFTGVRIGPTGGWSYNSQYLKMKGLPAVVNGLQYNNRWQGAWVGADAILDFCKWGVHAGYEYHFPHWHGEWLLKGSDSPGTYSDVRSANKGSGNVAFFEAFADGPGCFRLNLQVKYQYWHMRDGSSSPKFSNIADVGFGPNEVVKVSKSTWQSFEVTGGLGFWF